MFIIKKLIIRIADEIQGNNGYIISMKRFLLIITGLCILPVALFTLGLREQIKNTEEPATVSTSYNGIVHNLTPTENGRVIITVLIEKFGNDYRAVRNWDSRSRITVKVSGPAAAELERLENIIVDLEGLYIQKEKNPWQAEMNEAVIMEIK